MLHLNKTVIPNQSLGGIYLRQSAKEFLSFAIKNFSLNEIKYNITDWFNVEYEILNGLIAVAIDIRVSKVYRITAKPGFDGKFEDKISIGMEVKKAMQAEPNLYYSERDEVILCKNVPGISFDISDEDPPLEIVPDLLINGMSVFAVEALTPQGQKGNW